MLRSLARCLTLVPSLAVAFAPAQSTPQGHIDPNTWVSAPLGTFGNVAYVRYEAMFAGVTANNRPFRVPCQIIAPAQPAQGSGLLLFDWLVPSTIPTAVGQEQADARYILTDAFLFGRGIAYATVRCQTEAIGTSSPVADSTRPWSDALLDTSSEFIVSAGDEFDIVVSWLAALRTDQLALQALGDVQRRAAFAYSAAGYRLRGLLRKQEGTGQFDFSLVGGTGNGYAHPKGNGLAFVGNERAPLAGAGLEIDFQTETEVVALGGHKTRHEEANYRDYQFAGASHLRQRDAYEFGLADPETANPADWVAFVRALFVAGDNWCDGIQPPASIWLGAPNDPQIARDQNGNALVTYVGGLPYGGTGYRLPAVAVGENRYIPFDPSYNTGPWLGWLRALSGSHVDLTGNFTSHAGYVAAITLHAVWLQGAGYLLQEDVDAIILDATLSSIGS
jgi:hypothetical protein